MGLALWKMQKVRTDPNLTRYRSRKDRCRLQNGSYGLETDPIGSRKDRYRFENDPYRWQKIHSDRKTIGMDGKNDRYEPPRDPYHEKIQLCREPNGLCRDPYGTARFLFSPKLSRRLTLPLVDLFCSLVFGLPHSGVISLGRLAKSLRPPAVELYLGRCPRHSTVTLTAQPAMSRFPIVPFAACEPLAKAKRPNVFTFGRCSLNVSLAEDA